MNKNIEILQGLYNENIERWNWNQERLKKGIDINFYQNCNKKIQEENIALLTGIEAIKKNKKPVSTLPNLRG